MLAARLLSGAAGAVVAGLAMAPAHAATTLVLDQSFIVALEPYSVVESAIEPAGMTGTTLSMPSAGAGSTVTHRGGMELKSGTGFVKLTNISLNRKTGKASAMVQDAYSKGPIKVGNLLVFKGGKNTLKKNGKWTNATVRLAKSAVVGDGQRDDPVRLLSTGLGFEPDALTTGQRLGRATIVVKR